MVLPGNHVFGAHATIASTFNEFPQASASLLLWVTQKISTLGLAEQSRAEQSTRKHSKTEESEAKRKRPCQANGARQGRLLCFSGSHRKSAHCAKQSAAEQSKAKVPEGGLAFILIGLYSDWFLLLRGSSPLPVDCASLHAAPKKARDPLPPEKHTRRSATEV